MSRVKKKMIGEVVMSNATLPCQANPIGLVHGAELIKLMDHTAGAIAVRYAHRFLVTARIDEVQFLAPVHIGDVVSCRGRLIFVGHTSLEVEIKTYKEQFPDGVVSLVASAYFTMVCSENGKSLEIPELVLETAEEQRLFEEGRQRQEHYRKMR